METASPGVMHFAADQIFSHIAAATDTDMKITVSYVPPPPPPQ